VTTTIDQVQHYTAGPLDVFAMLSDPAFIEKKCLASGSIEASAEVTTEDAGTTIVSRRVLPAKLPGFAKKFVGETLTLIETQNWTDDDEGTRTATFVVDFGNNPISFGGNVTLRPDGSGTRVEYIGDIKCGVPFVGGKIEGVAQDWITRYLDKEQRVGTEWLDGSTD